MTTVKGYKATDKNGQCLNFQFKVGKTYKTDKLIMCKKGFHFCENVFDVYNYYAKDKTTRIFEVEAIGEVLKESDKSCTNEIKIIRELELIEILDIWIKRTNSGDYNSGDYNSGNRNSGDYNSGYYNSGNRNSGYYNSGDYNSGDYNSGYYNSGYYNSGYYNSGNRNSGYYNSGYYNSGYYNSGDYNSGYCNSDTPTVRLFNKQTDMKFDDRRLNIFNILKVKPILQYVETSNMTEEEKINNPSHKTTGGFLRNTGKLNWTEFLNDKEQVKAIMDLPGYDDEVFKEISGHSLLQPKTLKVTVNGQEIEVDMEKAKQLGLIK